jgi:CRP-like cAMP-binding protein
MIPHRLYDLMLAEGTLHTYAQDEVFHAQHFDETLFLLKSGYVKRYQVSNEKQRVIELIYGPGSIFPLSHIYKRTFGIEQNQTNLIYVYQPMTDIEIYSVPVNDVLRMVENNKDLYIDLYYESGQRLVSNIQRLASNALIDDYKKIAHQLVSLANEFGDPSPLETMEPTQIQVPLSYVDMAEQVNISPEVAEAVMANLIHRGLITYQNQKVTIPDVDALKDVYL